MTDAVREALERLLSFAENDSPGGCTGEYADKCAHCAAIVSARAYLLFPVSEPLGEEEIAKIIFWTTCSIQHDHEENWSKCYGQVVYLDCARTILSRLRSGATGEQVPQWQPPAKG